MAVLPCCRAAVALVEPPYCAVCGWLRQDRTSPWEGALDPPSRTPSRCTLHSRPSCRTIPSGRASTIGHVRRSKLHTELVAGRPVTGLFAPSGADFATPGILSWTEEQGAELQLVDLSDPWPSDFGDSFTVHGKPHTGDEVTLLRARVQSKTAFERTTHITSGILALGDHSDVEERWPIANYSPASLHEWIPDTAYQSSTTVTITRGWLSRGMRPSSVM